MAQIADSIKIVAYYNTNKAINPMRNRFDGAFENILNTALTEFMDGTDLNPVSARFAPGWTVTIAPVRLIEDFEGVTNDWEAYKKIVIQGDLQITDAEYTTDVSQLFEDLKAGYNLEAGGQGYNPPNGTRFDNTIVNFHVHYADDRDPVAGEL